MAVGNLDDLAAHSFDLVNRELASTLDHARRELEDYVDGNSAQALLRTAELLHLARGALKIVEIHGAALLAEEMEQTCRRLAEPGEQAKDEQGLEALTRAMVQLPAYLERLLGGGKDVALVLLPLLNDLRQARDKPSLSEGTLVLLNAGPFERHLEAHAGAVAPDAGRGFEKVAQRLRPAFQSALLGWIKGNDVGRHLDELLRVSLGLERAAGTDQVRQLWTVIVAVLTAIRAGGLEATVTLKRLLGQADRQLKRLIDGGEAAIVNAPPVDLLNSLLYYVARSTYGRHSDHEAPRHLRPERHAARRRAARAGARRARGTEHQAHAHGRARDQRRPRRGQGRPRYLRAHGHAGHREARPAARAAQEDRRHARRARPRERRARRSNARRRSSARSWRATRPSTARRSRRSLRRCSRSRMRSTASW